MKRNVLLLLAGLASIVATEAANIHWISFHPGDSAPSAAATAAGFTQAPDVGYTNLLASAGHSVTRVVSSDLPNAAVLNASDLVIISRSVPSGHYELDAETAAWNGLTAPVMILGGYILRNNRLGYTTGTTIPDAAATSFLTALNPSHPIFQGISLNAGNQMVNPFAHIVQFNAVNQRGISVNTDAVAGGGTILAVDSAVGGANGGMIIAEWAAGASMGNSPPDTLGGHRLVFLTGSRENSGLTSEGSGIYDLDPDGAQMFLNAVNYMAIPEPSTVLALVFGSGLTLIRRRRRGN
jgi:hypothetical protein